MPSPALPVSHICLSSTWSVAVCRLRGVRVIEQSDVEDVDDRGWWREDNEAIASAALVVCGW